MKGDFGEQNGCKNKSNHKRKLIEFHFPVSFP